MEAIFGNLPQENQQDVQELQEFLSAFGATGHITEWKGHRFGTVFRADTTEYACTEWDVRDGDVLVCSYPRSGTHWMKECVRLLLYGDNDKLSHLSASLPIPLMYIESGPVSTLRLIDLLPFPRRILVTHLPADLLPLDNWLKKDIKVVHIVRNPKDQAVSMYHFTQHFPESGDLRFPTEWSEWLDFFVSGQMATSLKKGEFHPEYIRTWIPYLDHPKVLPLTYERMVKEHLSCVRQIARFIGSNDSEDLIKKVTESTTIRSMKEDLNRKTDPSSLGLQKIELYRKGGVGGWKNYFTEEQSTRMDEIIDRKLGSSGYTFIYE